MKNRICPSLLLILVFTSLAIGQRTIPFRIASDDRTAKFSFSDWSVMGKFDGTIEISTDEKKQRLRVRLTGGELVATSGPKTVVAITPFLAKRSNKTFAIAERAKKETSVDKTLDVRVPFKLDPHEFLIEIDGDEDLSKYWLAFEISIKCEYPSCTVYAHSRGDIFK